MQEEELKPHAIFIWKLTHAIEDDEDEDEDDEDQDEEDVRAAAGLQL